MFKENIGLDSTSVCRRRCSQVSAIVVTSQSSKLKRYIKRGWGWTHGWAVFIAWFYGALCARLIIVFQSL